MVATVRIPLGDIAVIKNIIALSISINTGTLQQHMASGNNMGLQPI
jgi:hypothetical protein